MVISQLLKVRKIFAAYANEQLPSRLAYKIMKFLKATDADEAFFSKKMNEIVNVYSEKDEKGKPIVDKETGGIRVVESLIPECQNKINELSGTEIELPQTKFNLDELDGLKMSITDMALIDQLIIE